MGHIIQDIRSAATRYYEENAVEVREMLVDDETFIQILAETGFVGGSGSEIYIDGIRIYTK